MPAAADTLRFAQQVIREYTLRTSSSTLTYKYTHFQSLRETQGAHQSAARVVSSVSSHLEESPLTYDFALLQSPFIAHSLIQRKSSPFNIIFSQQAQQEEKKLLNNRKWNFLN